MVEGQVEGDRDPVRVAVELGQQQTALEAGHDSGGEPGEQRGDQTRRAKKRNNDDDEPITGEIVN